MILSPATTSAVFDIIGNAEASNQGRATVYTLAEEVAEALKLAGYRIAPGLDIFGKPCHYVLTPRAWAATVSEQDAAARLIVDRINEQQARKGYRF